MSSLSNFVHVYTFLSLTKELHKKFAKQNLLYTQWNLEKNIEFEIIRLPNCTMTLFFALLFGIEQISYKKVPRNLKTIVRIPYQKILRTTALERSKTSFFNVISIFKVFAFESHLTLLWRISNYNFISPHKFTKTRLVIAFAFVHKLAYCY